jgi:hypothetical protein
LSAPVKLRYSVTLLLGLLLGLLLLLMHSLHLNQ